MTYDRRIEEGYYEKLIKVVDAAKALVKEIRAQREPHAVYDSQPDSDACKIWEHHHIIEKAVAELEK